MTIEKNPHDKNYPYIISGPWGGVIYTNEEGLRELQKEINKMLDKSANLCYNTHRKEVNEMTNFLFEDIIDGGFFFVQCDSVEEAYEIIWEEIACEHSGLVHSCADVPEWYDYLGDYTDAQAEAMGYDTFQARGDPRFSH